MTRIRQPANAAMTSRAAARPSRLASSRSSIFARASSHLTSWVTSRMAWVTRSPIDGSLSLPSDCGTSDLAITCTLPSRAILPFSVPTGDPPAYGVRVRASPGASARNCSLSRQHQFPRQVILRDYYPVAPRSLPAFCAAGQMAPPRKVFRGREAEGMVSHRGLEGPAGTGARGCARGRPGVTAGGVTARGLSTLRGGSREPDGPDGPRRCVAARGRRTPAVASREPGTAYRATKLRLVMPGGHAPRVWARCGIPGRITASAAFLGPRSRGYPAAVPGRLSLAPFLRRMGGQGKTWA